MARRREDALFLRFRDRREPAALARVFDRVAPDLLRVAVQVEIGRTRALYFSGAGESEIGRGDMLHVQVRDARERWCYRAELEVRRAPSEPSRVDVRLVAR